MNIISIILNDTVALSDSTIIELAKVVNTCRPCIHEAETTCNDVKIVGIICLAIVLTVLIVSVAFYLWQKAKCDNEIKVSEQKFKHEIEKANFEAEIKKNEKDNEQERYKARCEFDLEKDYTLEKNKTEYQKVGRFLEQICAAAKEKDGHINKDILQQLLDFYKERKES